MSSRSSSGEPQTTTASTHQSPSPASAHPGTSPKAAQHDASVEMKDLKSGNGSPKGSIPLGEDIMQIARIGEVPVMQKLFESRKFNAGYTDEEGITPLHVCI